MPKLRVFSGAALCDLLIKHGFERVRQRGSHVIMCRGQVSFPVPLHRHLDRGTLRGIIRQADFLGRSSNDLLLCALPCVPFPVSVS